MKKTGINIDKKDISECVAICLETIMQYYGYRMTVEEIQNIVGAKKETVTAYDIVKAAESMGLKAIGVKGSIQGFFKNFTLPCIAHVIKEGTLLYFIIIKKITDKKIVIKDPEQGVLTITPKSFFGFNNRNEGAPKYKWTGVLILLSPQIGNDK